MLVPLSSLSVAALWIRASCEAASIYTNELAPALSKAEARNGGASGSTTAGTDCSLMVYGAPSKRGDGTVAGVDAVGPLGGVWAGQCVRYGHPHDSRPVHSLFTSLHCFGADSASGWASCLIGHVHLCLAVGQVPVDLAEVVVVAEMVVAEMVVAEMVVAEMVVVE